MRVRPIAMQARGLAITVEYPVNLINLNKDHSEFQVCTGPIILPDLATWDGSEVQRVFLAHVAFTEFDHVEFILRREVEAAPAEQEWLRSTARSRPPGTDSTQHAGLRAIHPRVHALQYITRPGNSRRTMWCCGQQITDR